MLLWGKQNNINETLGQRMVRFSKFLGVRATGAILSPLNSVKPLRFVSQQQQQERETAVATRQQSQVKICM